MSLQREWRRARAIAWKDLTAERRSKAGFNGVVTLAVTMLAMFGFALGPDAQALRDAAAGTVWLAALFAGVLAFNRSYQVELDGGGGALEQLVLYPGSRRTIFAGKLLANFAFVGMMLVFVVPVGIVLFQVRVPARWPALVAVMLLGVVGLVTLGTFYAAMASRSRAREVLLPLLLFPMLVPVLLAAMEATKALLGGNVMSDAGAWVKLLAVFDVIFLFATFLAFEAVIEV
jgi:heme exporter protein B